MAHVKCNLKTDEYLTVSPNPNEGFETKEDVDRFIVSLPVDRRDKVRLLMGHSVYFGIHKSFGRPAKYFTFVRSPVEQAISQYNYVLKDYAFFSSSGKYGWGTPLPAHKSAFNFSKWCDVFDVNAQTSTILNYLIDGRIGTVGQSQISEAHVERAKHILDEFYFVGLTEYFDRDSRFLYHELGFTKRIAFKINETPHADLSIDDSLLRQVADRVGLDRALYDHAVALNAAFRREHHDYDRAVERFQAQARPVLPIRVLVLGTARRLFGLQMVIWLWRLKNALTQ